MKLPASKELWEAKTNAEWETSYRRHISTQKGNEVPTIRDLKAAHALKPGSGYDKGCADALQEWSSSVDDFGTMLIMAIR